MVQVNVPYDRIEAFCRRWQVRELAVCGSVRCEDSRPDSDVDVLVSFEDDAPWNTFDLVVMQDDLEGLSGRPVDLVEKEGLRNPFRRRAILADHEVLYTV